MLSRPTVVLLVLFIASTLVIIPALGSAAVAAPQGGPPPPSGLDVFPRQEDLGLRVTLTWNHRPDCSAYRVYRSEEAGGPYECVGGVSGATMSDFPFFLDDGAGPKKTYYYRVSAINNGWQEGPQSDSVRTKTKYYMLAHQRAKSIVVSLADQRVYFYEDNVIVNILRCSTGAGGTPTGHYRIMDHRGWVSGCAYWMDWRPNYGMHAWPSYLGGYEENLGVTPRSHGCVRLHPLEAPWAYYWANDGTPFTVVDYPLGKLPFQGTSTGGGVTKLSRTWYFAEGFTGGSSLENLVLFNPGTKAANALTKYFPEAGRPVVENYYMPPGTRQAVLVNNVTGLAPGGTAIRVNSDVPIAAERTEYFEYNGRRGGNANAGAAEPSKSWYFAEGNTGGMYDTYLLMFNPGRKSSKVHLTFYPEGGAPVALQAVLAPLTRGTILVNAVPGVAEKGVAFKVESEWPIVAERTVYFATGPLPNGINGGDCTSGAKKAGKLWYLPEGTTDNLFGEYIFVFNPTGDIATVNLMFFPPTGPYGHQIKVAPRSRGTLAVDSIPGLENTETGAQVTSDRDITVERTMYCSRDSLRGGDCSSGLPALSSDWYFAEGNTGGTFDEYLLLLNPGDAQVNVHVTFHADNGSDIPYACAVPPKRRLAVHVDEIPGVDWTGASVEVHADKPIAAERTEFFCIPR